MSYHTHIIHILYTYQLSLTLYHKSTESLSKIMSLLILNMNQTIEYKILVTTMY